MSIDVTISKVYPTFFYDGTPNCATTDPELFFPEKGAPRGQVSRAKKVCSNCQYIKSCLEWALRNKEIGVWGGTTPNERRILRKKTINKKAVL